MTQPDSELLLKSCNAAETFPKNLVHHGTPKYLLDAYYERLNETPGRRFCQDGDASLDIWEYYDLVKKFQNTLANSIFDVKGRLEGKSLFSHHDPRCRFIFIHATHSRERLLTSRKMLTCLLTHHQVMANFLDFVFPFGMKEYPEDYHFSGFREETRISFSDTRLNIPQLGRTGFELRMCYSLRTVEPSDNDPNWPWSIRQTAIYHSFDVKSGKSFWIVIKGSNLIRDRVQAATAPKIGDQPELKSFETTAKAFNSTLATHLLLCDWCNEDWRWYLNFLEKEVQRLTRRSLAVAVTKAPSLIEASAYYPVPEPPMSLFRSVSTFTKRTLSIPRQFSFASSLREKTWFKPSFPVREELIQYPSSEPASPRPPPVLPPHLRQPKPEGAPSESSDFSFEKLQKVQFIEDNVNEVQLVLEANIKTLTELKEHYRSVFNSADCPPDIKSYSQGKMAHFGKRISQIVGDLEMQLSSTRTLLRLVQNRKSLLYGILNYRSIEATKVLSEKSNHSAKRMEDMTDSMHKIAVKTKQETVSMRIITLVTLFFLPGTFTSTIMSTSIFQVPGAQSEQGFQPGALNLWLAITLPLMLLTFAAWLVVYWWINRREKFKEGGERQEAFIA